MFGDWCGFYILEWIVDGDVLGVVGVLLVGIEILVVFDVDWVYDGVVV